MSTPINAPLSQRYASAWQEIGQRIQARQNVNLVLFTTSFGVVPLYIFKLIETYSSQSNISQNNQFKMAAEAPYFEAPYLFMILAVSISFIAWSFSFWITHNDKTIGLLSAFCGAIEKLDNPRNDLLLPAWHDGAQSLIGMALTERRWGGYASTIALCVCGAPGLICSAYFVSNYTYSIFLTYTLTSSVAFAANRVVDISKFREKLLKADFGIRFGKADFFFD